MIRIVGILQQISVKKGPAFGVSHSILVDFLEQKLQNTQSRQPVEVGKKQKPCINLFSVFV